MPELPEVETIRRYLEKVIVGKKITCVEILSEKQFLGKTKDIIGAKIIGLERRAKYLILNLNNKKSLLIHLKLTGQLVWQPEVLESPGRTTRIIIGFDKGTLSFNDRRRFGWLKIVQSSALHKEIMGKLGPEPFSKDFSVDYLKQIFQKTSQPIKLVLLDQEKIAGIGNIYANEALFEAKINPQKPAKTLNQKEISRLKKAVVYVLKQGIKHGGSLGKFQQYFSVYQKQGQKCQKCGTIIKRINVGGRGTFFCPRCQA